MTPPAAGGNSELLGLAGFRLTRWSADEVFTRMKSWGLAHLDYWGNGDGLTTEQFAERAHEAGIRIYALNLPGLNLFAPFPDRDRQDEAQAAVRRAVDSARRIGATFVQIYPETARTPNFRDAISLAAEQLTRAADYAAAQGVTLAIENNNNRSSETDLRPLNPSVLPELLAAVVEAVDSPFLRICFDACNWYTNGVEPFPYAYEELQDWIVNVQFKDVTRYSASRHRLHANAGYLVKNQVGRSGPSHTADGDGDFLPVPVGQGAINWHGLASQLSLAGYTGWRTLDPYCSDSFLEHWIAESLRAVRALP